MIVYHGSNSNFSKLRVSPRLTRSSSGYLSEGYGIYFSLNRDIAKQYGKYLYTLSINDNLVIDFRKISNCRKFLYKLLNYIKRDCNVDLVKYIKAPNVDVIINLMHNGKLGINSLGRELNDILNANCDFYSDLSESCKDNIFRKIRVNLKKMLAVYLFNNEIPNIGILKDISSNTVKIIGKEMVRQ